MSKFEWPEIREVNVTRYITPLREGGSLPAIVDADDDFKYVLKFRGAGQGAKALIAELLGGQIAKQLGLRTPELVFAHLDEAFGRTEPDEEIQDLLKASVGKNLGLHFLSGALNFDPVSFQVSPEEASNIVWLDSFIKNVDRTVRNTNMLIWQKELWLIDHGASFYFHHSWNDWESQAGKEFQLIENHVLLQNATQLEIADQDAHENLNEAFFKNIVNTIPEEWLLIDSPFQNIDEHRNAYVQYLNERFQSSSKFVKEANDARLRLI